MTVSSVPVVVVAVTFMMTAASASAQAVAGPEKARPVQGDPGISSMAVIDTTQFRVLRDYAEPGATRRMHNHPDATYHVFVLITGRLLLTVQSEPPVEVGPGEALSLKGGAMHTFRNTGEQTATIVEVFGKGPGVADLAVARTLATALAPAPSRQ